jgi:hypothetical protein
MTTKLKFDMRCVFKGSLKHVTEKLDTMVQAATELKREIKPSNNGYVGIGWYVFENKESKL